MHIEMTPSMVELLDAVIVQEMAEDGQWSDVMHYATVWETLWKAVCGAPSSDDLVRVNWKRSKLVAGEAAVKLAAIKAELGEERLRVINEAIDQGAELVLPLPSAPSPDHVPIADVEEALRHLDADTVPPPHLENRVQGLLRLRVPAQESMLSSAATEHRITITFRAPGDSSLRDLTQFSGIVMAEILRRRDVLGMGHVQLDFEQVPAQESMLSCADCHRIVHEACRAIGEAEPRTLTERIVELRQGALNTETELEATQFRADDWQRIANDCTKEILRLRALLDSPGSALEEIEKVTSALRDACNLADKVGATLTVDQRQSLIKWRRIAGR